ncbi:phosphoribosyltransferase [Paraburkholderia sp. T12-10]|nr:phosphoribosyltransferase [Paraburkholderia sp. T12-10]
MKAMTLGVIQPVAHLVEYHAYWIEDNAGGKVRNPEWTDDCKRLLNLKNVQDQGHGAAVAYYTKMVKAFLTDNGVPPANLQVHLVVVPSSKAGHWGDGLLKIGQNLMKQNGNFVDSMKALKRTKTIQKLAHGGNRSIYVHQQSIELGSRASRLERKAILLLDDITTSGNSLIACAEMLRTHCGAAVVMPLALGKTV